MKKIYLDYNATTPALPEVLEATQPFGAECFANPSSIHQAGQAVSRQIRKAREEVSLFLGAQDETEIVFTSGGTESNNAAFRSALWSERAKKKIVTTTVEHSSVLKLSKALQEEGIEICFCPVDSKGELDLGRLEAAMTPETALISVMMANNETGVLFPIEEIGKRAREKGILFHVDAVQGVGKIPLTLKSLPVDFLSFSGHKFGAPKGIGGLYVKKGVNFRSLIFGGSQERGRRAGTENVSGIIGLGAASKHLRESQAQKNEKIQNLRDSFEVEILKRIPGVQVNGDPHRRIPNTSNLSFERVDSEALLILLDDEGIFASSGSACLSGAPEPSHVLKAMGFSEERAKSSVRFSFGFENTLEEVRDVVQCLERLTCQLRAIELEEQHPHSVVK